MKLCITEENLKRRELDGSDAQPSPVGETCECESEMEYMVMATGGEGKSKQNYEH